MGRFINADGVIETNNDTLTYNLYSYCNNNPVNVFDTNGNLAFLIAGLIFAVKAYSTIKTAIQISSTIYLTLKKATATRDMFNQSMGLYYKDGVSNKVKKDLTNKIKKDPVFKEKVQKCIDDNKGKKFYSCHSDNVYFKQFDLKASVGHIDLYTSGRKIGEDHWKMYVTMEDVFDFDRWMKPTNKLNIANDLGYVMQRIGMLHTYSWDLDFEFEYEDGTIK